MIFFDNVHISKKQLISKRLLRLAAMTTLKACHCEEQRDEAIYFLPYFFGELIW